MTWFYMSKKIICTILHKICTILQIRAKCVSRTELSILDIFFGKFCKNLQNFAKIFPKIFPKCGPNFTQKFGVSRTKLEILVEIFRTNFEILKFSRNWKFFEISFFSKYESIYVISTIKKSSKIFFDRPVSYIARLGGEGARRFSSSNNFGKIL